MKQLWTRPSVRWGVLLVLVLLGVMLARFVPVLHGWISAHDKTGAGQFLLRPRAEEGVRQLIYLSALVESLTLPLTLAGALGIYVLWRERDRSLALLLICLSAFPVGFLTLISLRTAVSTYYLLPAVPVLFLGAGVFIDRLFEVDRPVGPRWLLPVALTTVIVTAGVPTLISDYRDGRRYDFRRVARWLEERLGPGDVVFSDQPMVLAHYLPGTRILKLRSNPTPLVDSLGGLTRAGRGGALWIVAPAPSNAFRSNLKAGGLSAWIYGNCQLRTSVGVGRVDFRQEYLEAFRCPPEAATGPTPVRSDGTGP